MALVGSFYFAIFISVGFISVTVMSLVLADRLISVRLFLDRPNERSSHLTATPRSGGIAIFFPWAVFMVFCAITSRLSAETNAGLSPEFFTSMAVSAALAFALGLIDDRFTLKARHKLYIQISIGVLFVLMFGGLTTVPVPVLGAVTLGLFGPLVSVFWIVAFMNAFNFMDGLNGIAGLCAIIVYVALALISTQTGAVSIAVIAGAMAFAITGFLWRNYPKGEIFLGDGGALFIAYLFAILAILASRGSELTPGAGNLSALFVPTAFLPFLFDVAFTLSHRAWRGESLLAAHRDHIYQLLARSGVSRVYVTALYGFLTLASAGAAYAMHSLAPAYQWSVPLSIAVLLLAPATLVYRRSVSSGLLASRANQKPVV